MFDNNPIAEKELSSIEGTTRRWNGYTYFQKNARRMLERFDTYMK
jgi:uncharacterized protein